MRRAYNISVGVNNFENPAWNLRYAASDALATQEILTKTLKDKFAEVVGISLVSDGKQNSATKSNIQTVFDLLAGKKPGAEKLKALTLALGAETLKQIQQAHPNDAVFILFSSHGYADANGIFYILPSNIGANNAKLTPDLLAHALSSDELSLWLRDVDAGEMVMIVDACDAAAFKGKDFKPAPMGSRGLGQLAYDKGMKILAATQEANSAIETGGAIKHGLLTYALLTDGIENKAADFRSQDKEIRLREWLEYGEYRVPKLYEEVATGKLKGIEVEGERTNNAALQRPSLFDFSRKREDLMIIRLP